MIGEKRSINRMVFDIGRLERMEQTVGIVILTTSRILTTPSVSFDKNER